MKHKKNYVITALLLTLTMALNSCTAIEGIFKAGMWTGIIFVIVIVAVIIWIISRVTRK